MNTQLEPNMNYNAAEIPAATENPMQERHIGEVAESVEATAEDILTARRLDAQDDAGPIFVP
jgi:hypothetical protein